jgi:Ca-activated chloride channel family protein
MWSGSRRPGGMRAALVGMISLIAVAGAGHAQLSPTQTSGQLPIFRYGVNVELVDLFASVRDTKGKLITKLRRDDFLVYDNGIPQSISEFSREYCPLSVLILLDTSGSMAGRKLDNARRSLVQFLKRLNSGDEAMLIAFQARARIVESFTQDLDRMRRDLRRMEGTGSTALYDAILLALDQVNNAHNRRKTLLLISDGINTYGRTQLKDTIETLRRRGVELFAIGMESNLPEDARERAATHLILSELTASAGGESFLVSDSKDLPRVCHTISDQMHNQYTLGYYPPKARTGEWRKIKVETRIPGLTVVTSKTGYYPSKSKGSN